LRLDAVVWHSASVREVTTANFGLLIAYLIPGFVMLIGVSELSPAVASWLATNTESGPTFGGFLYGTLASVMAGLTASTVRWLILDSLHHRTGLRQLAWDFSRLQTNVSAFDVLIEIHYRYYQFYGNTLVALLFDLVVAVRGWPLAVVVAILCVLFFLGSRDTLRKYYERVGQFLAGPEDTPRGISQARGAVLPDQ
jgi:hypothetical protein